MIKSEDKIADVIMKFPHIKEKLIERNKRFENLNNPVLFNTIGKFARISDISKVSGEKLEDLLAFINEIIFENQPLFHSDVVNGSNKALNLTANNEIPLLSNISC